MFVITGNTSMDAGLSLLMSNLGQVKQNSVVLDPFVGTGMPLNIYMFIIRLFFSQLL